MHNYALPMHNYSLLKHSNSSAKLHAALIGGHGYSGQEVLRSLLLHPHVAKITFAQNQREENLAKLLPEEFSKPISIVSMGQLLESFNNKQADLEKLDVVFLATPAEVSLELVPLLLEKNINVIDLSGAFRLQDPKLYEKWYKFHHTATTLLPKAHYGLSPFNNLHSQGTQILNDPKADLNSTLRSDENSTAKSVAVSDEFKNSKEAFSPQFISNPGCYATAILMALVPLLKHKIIDPASIAIDAKSGTSGAGRKASESLLFNEVDQECLPYKIAEHQHFPEICEHIQNLCGVTIDPHFTTSLLPVRRGIIAGIYAKTLNSFPSNNALAAEALLTEAYTEAYKNYPLVKFGPTRDPLSAQRLSLKKVVGSARTHITYSIDSNKLYLFSTIDNLMKGAATQAIENMNHLFGWDVTTGLLQREGVL